MKVVWPVKKVKIVWPVKKVKIVWPVKIVKIVWRVKIVKIVWPPAVEIDKIKGNLKRSENFSGSAQRS